jgi:hypothetical protein
MYEKIAAEAKKQGYLEDDSLNSFDVEQGDKITPNGGKKWSGMHYTTYLHVSTDFE